MEYFFIDFNFCLESMFFIIIVFFFYYEWLVVKLLIEEKGKIMYQVEVDFFCLMFFDIIVIEDDSYNLVLQCDSNYEFVY